MKLKQDCVRRQGQTSSDVCGFCKEKHRRCSLTVPKKRGKSETSPKTAEGKGKGRASTAADAGSSKDGGKSEKAEKSAGVIHVKPLKAPARIISSIAKSLTGKSSENKSSSSPVEVRNPETVPPSFSQETTAPGFSQPYVDFSRYREVSMPSTFASPGPPFASTSSLLSFDSRGSTGSLPPATEFELEDLRRKYRESQEDLNRTLQRAREAEEAYQRELDRRQREIEFLRAQQGGAVEKSKRRR